MALKSTIKTVILTSLIFSGYTPAYSSFEDSFYFIPELSVEDAAISAAIQAITGKNIYQAAAMGLINDRKFRSGHLCNGQDETLDDAIKGNCLLINGASKIAIGVDNPIIEQYGCRYKKMAGMPTSCFVYQLAPFLFDNIQYRQQVVLALESPCQYLTPLDQASQFSGFKYPHHKFLTQTAFDSFHILDCKKKRPETFSTTVDEKTQSILVIRNQP